MPACTTKRRTTTNLKLKNHENCQKIELYGSLTTKDLKKKLSSRPVGGVEMGIGAGRTLREVAGEVVAGGDGGPTFACR